MKQNQLFVIIALGVIIASFIYPVATLILGLQVEGYSHLRDLISELGVSHLPYAWILTTVLIVDSVLVIGLAIAIQQSIGQRGQNQWAAIFVGLFGATLLIGGLFPCDIDCRPNSLNGWMHVLNFLPSLVATVGAPFLMQRKFAEDKRLSLFATASLILGVLTVVFVASSVVIFPLLALNGLGIGQLK